MDCQGLNPQQSITVRAPTRLFGDLLRQLATGLVGVQRAGGGEVDLHDGAILALLEPVGPGHLAALEAEVADALRERHRLLLQTLVVEVYRLHHLSDDGAEGSARGHHWVEGAGECYVSQQVHPASHQPGTETALRGHGEAAHAGTEGADQVTPRRAAGRDLGHDVRVELV